MYTAITILEGYITGKHKSTEPMTATTFAGTAYEGHEVKEVQADAEYAEGHFAAEYTSDGRLRPLIDRVREGVTPCPPGFELVDDELVPINPKPEQTPEKLQETIDTLRAQVAALQRAVLDL